MKKIILVFILLGFNYCYGQVITISGKVLNKNQLEPVLFANIAVKGFPIGVSSNEMGEFSFHVPDFYGKDTLSVSAIGFKSFECAINQISKTDSLIICLDEQIYELHSVIVFPEDELKDIIKNVTKNIKKNYPKRTNLLNGFYRELTLRDNNYTRLIEAAIDIQRPGINSTEGNLVRVNELRKSDSYIEYDWKSKLFNKINGERNQLYSILVSDIIYSHNKTYVTKDILTNNFINSYDFVLENISMIDSIRVFEIRFFDKKYYGEYDGNFVTIENHWISVREDSYAIIKYEFKLQIVKNFDKLKYVNFEDNCIVSCTVYYKEYEGKYYPYLYEKMTLANAKYADENTGKGKQYMKSTLLINNIVTKRSDEYEKVKKRFSSPADVDLYNQDFKYNPAFWSNYNILQLNPIYKQAKQDLEFGKSLEEQFIQNGK
ncbi:MAG: carboxypeptidase-like regulatory domain-containing protein [Bacteroidales bacterium]|jgi:hypothetical protein|nr:carboxypeptidase-like regulatory domain-containing protein [Bacteroidales bacterium]